jgi:hypothetical protein
MIKVLFGVYLLIYLDNFVACSAYSGWNGKFADLEGGVLGTATSDIVMASCIT